MSMYHSKLLSLEHSEVFMELKESLSLEDNSRLTPAQTAIYLRPYCEQGRAALGVVSHRQLIGACLCSFFKHYVLIDLILVRPNYRRQGVGRNLIEALLKIADARGGLYAAVHCASLDTRLLDWYQTLGFQIVTSTNKAGYVGLTLERKNWQAEPLAIPAISA